MIKSVSGRPSTVVEDEAKSLETYKLKKTYKSVLFLPNIYLINYSNTFFVTRFIYKIVVFARFVWTFSFRYRFNIVFKYSHEP